MKRLICILFGALLLFSDNALAYSSYEEIEAEYAAHQKSMESFASTVADCSAFLAAVDSGDQEKWEKARNKIRSILAYANLDSKTEYEYIEAYRNIMLRMYYRSYGYAELSKAKKEVYFNKLVRKEETAFDLIDNDYPVYPSGIDNIWFLVARTSIIEDMALANNDVRAYQGLTYLVNGIITIQSDGNLRIVTDDQHEYSVLIPSDIPENVLCPATNGEAANVFITYTGGTADNAEFVLCWSEEQIEMFRVNRMSYLLSNGEY